MSIYWSTPLASTLDRDQRRPQTRDEMRKAVHELAARGMTVDTIAHATGLAVEQVRQLLGEPQP